jgi:hypothetical protein
VVFIFESHPECYRLEIASALASMKKCEACVSAPASKRFYPAYQAGKIADYFEDVQFYDRTYLPCPG